MTKLTIAVLILSVVAGIIYFNLKQYGYQIKKNKVYFVTSEDGGFGKVNNLIEEANLETFKVISGAYAKDNSRVYFSGRPIVGAEVKSFQLIKVDSQIIQDIYSRDDKNVYRGTQNLKISDPNSFKLFAGGYSLDSMYVYHDEVVVPGADPTSFQVIGKGYNWFGLDSQHVYYFGKILTDADALTFKILSFPNEKLFAKDKNHHFSSSGEIQ